MGRFVSGARDLDRFFPKTEAIPFDDLDSLELKLARQTFRRLSLSNRFSRKQASGVPTNGVFSGSSTVFMAGVTETLLVLDEVQDRYVSHRAVSSGAALWRGSRYGRVWRKAMSGGLVPVERGADDGRHLRFGLRIVTASDYPYLNFQRERPGHGVQQLATLEVLETEGN